MAVANRPSSSRSSRAPVAGISSSVAPPSWSPEAANIPAADTDPSVESGRCFPAAAATATSLAAEVRLIPEGAEAADETPLLSIHSVAGPAAHIAAESVPPQGQRREVAAAQPPPPEVAQVGTMQGAVGKDAA